MRGSDRLDSRGARHLSGALTICRGAGARQGSNVDEAFPCASAARGHIDRIVKSPPLRSPGFREGGPAAAQPAGERTSCRHERGNSWASPRRMAAGRPHPDGGDAAT